MSAQDHGRGQSAAPQKIAITFELEPVQMRTARGALVQAWALPFAVQFTRCPAVLDDLKPLIQGCGQAAYVGNVARLTAHEYDRFALNFRALAPGWLVQARAQIERLQNAAIGVLVVAPDRPALLVDAYSHVLKIAKIAP